MRSERNRVAVAAAAGVGYVLTGGVLLLQELGVVAVAWSFVVPLVLTVAGLALLGTAGAGGGATSPGRSARGIGDDADGRPPGW
ncbi:hypothetical protein PHK61_14505 [Actinomycetospora lutea]|uniref:hypothetical protein n=1 Tax=Actinomycetospora lutea TaxID=663604 RepID=UPI0023658738|nr:hypothetical protein [Actinomycetospora lutea]MDD7939632.1 hypothetical protein [Actinomycetospora lutea]